MRAYLALVNEYELMYINACTQIFWRGVVVPYSNTFQVFVEYV